MNLFLSLFGGMLATALLYGLGRVLKLSNLWAAVVACGLPSLAYVAYATGTRPGLDVITLHLVAYPTAAVLLYQLYGDKARRPRREGMHWVPRLMLAFFVLLSVLLGAFVHIAGHGLPPALAAWLLPGAKDGQIHTGFAGVVQHGQDAAKAISHHLKMEHRLAQLGWRLEVTGLKEVQAHRPVPVSVHVLDRNGQGVDGVDVRLSTARPGQAPIEVVRLTGDGSAGYHATLPPLSPGEWIVYLSLQPQGGQTITLEHGFQAL